MKRHIQSVMHLMAVGATAIALAGCGDEIHVDAADHTATFAHTGFGDAWLTPLGSLTGLRSDRTPVLYALADNTMFTISGAPPLLTGSGSIRVTPVGDHNSTETNEIYSVAKGATGLWEKVITVSIGSGAAVYSHSIDQHWSPKDCITSCP